MTGRDPPQIVRGKRGDRARGLAPDRRGSARTGEDGDLTDDVARARRSQRLLGGGSVTSDGARQAPLENDEQGLGRIALPNEDGPVGQVESLHRLGEGVDRRRGETLEHVARGSSKVIR